MDVNLVYVNYMSVMDVNYSVSLIIWMLIICMLIIWMLIYVSLIISC